MFAVTLDPCRHSAAPSPTNEVVTTATTTGAPPPASTSIADPGSPRDPKGMMRSPAEQAADLTAPLLDRRGTGSESFDIHPPSTARDVVIAVTCIGPGTFEVSDTDGRVLSGGCGTGMSSIRLSPDRLSPPLRLTAPGEWWIVVAPTH